MLLFQQRDNSTAELAWRHNSAACEHSDMHKVLASWRRCAELVPLGGSQASPSMVDPQEQVSGEVTQVSCFGAEAEAMPHHLSDSIAEVEHSKQERTRSQFEIIADGISVLSAEIAAVAAECQMCKDSCKLIISQSQEEQMAQQKQLSRLVDKAVCDRDAAMRAIGKRIDDLQHSFVEEQSSRDIAICQLQLQVHNLSKILENERGDDVIATQTCKERLDSFVESLESRSAQVGNLQGRPRHEHLEARLAALADAFREQEASFLVLERAMKVYFAREAQRRIDNEEVRSVETVMQKFTDMQCEEGSVKNESGQVAFNFCHKTVTTTEPLGSTIVSPGNEWWPSFLWAGSKSTGTPLVSPLRRTSDTVPSPSACRASHAASLQSSPRRVLVQLRELPSD
mmetsp:Transcript_129226/g.374099  ORF Transcript_129226/g.374099 Transcript_129226/m.374099 type:complete len:398 (+) Transcript_129226:178-1371(+)